MANTTGARSQTSGEYIRGNDVVKTDARAAELRGQGLSYAAIAREMGWASKASAFDAVHRAWRDTLTEPAEQARAVELARLEDAHDAALAVLLREHITVSHGRIVKDDDGNPIIDDAPILNAVDRIRALSESRRKLLGLDAPARVSVDAEHLGQEVADIINALVDAAAQAGTDDDPST